MVFYFVFFTLFNPRIPIQCKCTQLSAVEVSLVMEQVMKTFLDSTVTVLNPKYSKKVVCDTLLVNIRVLLCNEVLSNKLKRVLVEAIAPLARVSSGLSQPHELRGMLQPAFERLATISQEKKTEEFNIEEVCTVHVHLSFYCVDLY